MANHLTAAQIYTLLNTTTTSSVNLTVGQLNQIMDALDRMSFIRVTDGNVLGTGDPTLATLFPAPAGGANP